MKRILVVDDDESIRVLYTEELRAEGYEVFTACSGEDALAMTDDLRPDLVTLDIRMAEMNGVEALRRIKEKRPDLPVVICTAYPSYKDDFNIWASDAYVVKSSDVRELLETVRKILILRQPERSDLIGDIK